MIREQEWKRGTWLVEKNRKEKRKKKEKKKATWVVGEKRKETRKKKKKEGRIFYSNIEGEGGIK